MSDICSGTSPTLSELNCQVSGILGQQMLLVCELVFRVTPGPAGIYLAKLDLCAHSLDSDVILATLLFLNAYLVFSFYTSPPLAPA